MSRRLRCGSSLGLLIGLAAAAVDAQSPAAVLWLSRCASADAAAVAWAALRMDEHARAFPWTMLVMTVGCLLPWRVGAWAGLCAGMQPLLVMLLSMPLVCAAASGVIAPVPAQWQPHTYGAAMLLLSAMVERLRLVREFSRRLVADRLIEAQPLV